MAIRFDIKARASGTNARLGRLTTPHGSFDTPAFMPVGTKATVKGLLPDQVADLGSQILLANTYHLMLRPGEKLVEQLGGLHPFMGWAGPILTDSGGFQVFSLADVRQIDEDGVKFRSHLDGAAVDLTPERSMQVQNALGADIIMAFDDCPPAAREVASDGHGGEDESAGMLRHAVSPADYPRRNREAAERTARWLTRCTKAHARPADQALFGIIQGGLDLELRRRCVEQVCEHDLPGYAIGGCAVGEGHESMMRVVEHTTPLLPDDRPRYLMGVGYERDIIAAVAAGVDMFDCVLPTRNGRNANAFIPGGQMRLRNAQFADDPAPIDPQCDCPACRRFSRAYIRHLFGAQEMLGPILVSLHNIRFFQRLMLDIRRAIEEDNGPFLARRGRDAR